MFMIFDVSSFTFCYACRFVDLTFDVAYFAFSLFYAIDITPMLLYAAIDYVFQFIATCFPRLSALVIFRLMISSSSPFIVFRRCLLSAFSFNILFHAAIFFS